MRKIWFVRHNQESTDYRVERLDGMASFHVFGAGHRDVLVGHTVSLSELTKLFDNPQCEISIRDWTARDVIQRIAETDSGTGTVDGAKALRKGYERASGPGRDA